MKKIVLCVFAILASVQYCAAYDFEACLSRYFDGKAYFNILSEGDPNDKFNYVDSCLDWINDPDMNATRHPSATCEFTYKSVELIDGKLVYNKDYNPIMTEWCPAAVVSANGKRYSVVGVGAHAFENCENLGEIRMQKVFQHIGACAFKGCKSLKLPPYISVPFPTLQLEYADSVYYGCSSIEYVNLWRNAKVGKHAFYGCTNLKKVELFPDVDPTTITVGEGAFYHQTECGYECELWVNKELNLAEKIAQTYPWNKFKLYEYVIIPTGVNDVSVNKDAPVEYYNLQGVRLAKPEPGQIVIKRQGAHASKMIVK